MGKGSNSDDENDNENDGCPDDVFCRPPSQRPVPPPEAFQQAETPNRHLPLDPNNNNNNKSNNSNHPKDETIRTENKHSNGRVAAASTGAAGTASKAAMSAPPRPSLLIRRQSSSLFGQLPVRSKSRLFGDIMNSNTSGAFGNAKNNNKNSSGALFHNIASETAMSSGTSFSRSQSTWLQEDHQSTLIGGDEESSRVLRSSQESGPPPQSEQEPRQQQQREGKSSLFGAVMRQFGSSISGALQGPVPPSSPSRNDRKRPMSEGSPNGDTCASGGAFRGLMASPSGKTILSIVNQFNSPFKFQSPNRSGSKKKVRKRRRLWGDDDADSNAERSNDDSFGGDKESMDDDDDDDDKFVTPTKRRKIPLFEEEDENSKPTSSVLFPEHDNENSRSSLGGGLVDENWREAPIIDAAAVAATDDGFNSSGVRMEILDWSLPTRVRLEIHGSGSTPRARKPAGGILDTWIKNVMRDNEDALLYWMYQSSYSSNSGTFMGGGYGGVGNAGSTASTQLQGSMLHSQDNNSSFNFAVLRKSTGVTKTAMSRQNSLNSRSSSSRFDSSKPKPQHGKNSSSNSNKINPIKEEENEAPGSAHHLARYLIQLVRGPRAKYSRKRISEETFLWDVPPSTSGAQSQARGVLEDNGRERSERQWQQALLSLFSKYRRCVLNYHAPGESLDAMVLDTYFYCIGQDHSVLFRVASASDNDIGGNGSRNSDSNSNAKPVPVVLVSSTSAAFRKQLEQNGMDVNNGSDGNNTCQFLESIQEREARERQKIAAATAAAMRKNKGLFNNVLLSPGVKADLEALRRAQAFGESAGADVFVKTKKSNAGLEENDDKGEKLLPKAMRISGWDNVSLFSEVYSNLLGNAMGDCVVEHGASIAAVPGDGRLPLLVCPNTKNLGAFAHASLKTLRLFPAEQTNAAATQEPKKNENEAETSTKSNGNAMDICGILLPCVIRKLLLVTRNRILEDEKTTASVTKPSSSSSSSPPPAKKAKPNTDESDSSRYVVLQSTRSVIENSNNKHLAKSWIRGLSGSLVFNQGKRRKSMSNDTNKKLQHRVFECSYGKVISMAVWDSSREEVAACKVDDAFPDNWFHKK